MYVVRYLAWAKCPAGSCGTNRPTDEYELCPYCIISLVKWLQIYINVIHLCISWMPTMVIHCSWLQRILGSFGQTNPKRYFKISRGKWMEESCLRILGKASRRRQYLGWVVEKKEELDDRGDCGWMSRGWENVIASWGDDASKDKLLRNSNFVEFLVDLFLRVQNALQLVFPGLVAFVRIERLAQAVWACPRLQNDLVT